MMEQILTPIPILLVFATLYAVIGYRYFSVYRQMVWLGIMIIPLVAMPVYYSWKDLYVHFWPGMWAQFAWFLCCALMAEIYQRVRRASIVRLQAGRDREGAALLASLDRSPENSRKFALYLRPFRVTGNLPTSLPGAHYTESQFEGVLDFEGLLEDALRDTLPLVALGRPMETYGAGRILTDDLTWQTKIIEMMQAAQTIFVIPSNRPGTLWEVEHILQNNLIEKCLFIMPPTGAVKWTKEPEERWHYDEALVDQARDWQDTVQALAPMVRLPLYEQSGALFTISPSGEVNKYSQMPLLLPKFTGVARYLEAIRETIAELRNDPAAVAESSAHRAIATDAGFFGHEAKEYDVTPGGFEITVFGRTWRAGVGCFVLGCLLLFVIVRSWGHWKTMFLLGLEGAVATILLSTVMKAIRLFRD